MDTRREIDVGLERRATLLLGIASASAVVFGQGRHAFGQQVAPGEWKEVAAGVTKREVAEVSSTVPGFAKVTLVEVTWQAGAKTGPTTMKDAMVCEMSAGALDETKNNKPVPRKTGDVWTCAVGDVDIDVNNGTVPATMRIFSLVKA
jgi:hypothetical protein